MPVNSREKGKRFERLLAHKFEQYGYKTRRTAQYCGNTGEASDVTGLPFVHVEAKHVEQARIYDFLEQAVRDAEKDGRIPTVFYKKNGKDIVVMQYFDDWMRMYQVYEKSRGTE